MNNITDETFDFLHGFDISKMNKDLDYLNKAIEKTEDLINSNETSERQKDHLKKFKSRCKLMKYRIENRIKILEEDTN